MNFFEKKEKNKNKNKQKTKKDEIFLDSQIWPACILPEFYNNICETFSNLENTTIELSFYST